MRLFSLLYIAASHTEHVHYFSCVFVVVIYKLPIHKKNSAKRCACKGLCTSVENKTLLKTVFI